MNVHDIEAIGDVLDQIAEAADSLDAKESVEFMVALNAVNAKLKIAMTLCETQAKRTLDGQPIKVGDTLYVEKDTGKWRPDQSRIRARVVSMAAVDLATGEIVAGPIAAERAVDMMYQLFVSPSTMPKVGGLDYLGLDKRDVADWERTGTALEAVELRSKAGA